MTCQACGQGTGNRPALCDDCRTERLVHGRVKGAARWTALVSRLEKRRRWVELEARISALEVDYGVRPRQGGTS
jgi:hypothetical protein